MEDVVSSNCTVCSRLHTLCMVELRILMYNSWKSRRKVSVTPGNNGVDRYIILKLNINKAWTWFHMTLYRLQWRHLAETVMNFQTAWKRRMS
jgi:hypothetical protein